MAFIHEPLVHIKPTDFFWGLLWPSWSSTSELISASRFPISLQHLIRTSPFSPKFVANKILFSVPSSLFLFIYLFFIIIYLYILWCSSKKKMVFFSLCSDLFFPLSFGTVLKVNSGFRLLSDYEIMGYSFIYNLSSNPI